jgi:hypothetical protein
MSRKSIPVILFVLGLCASNITLAVDPNIIAEYTDIPDFNCQNNCTFYRLLVSADYTQAMAFDVAASPTLTEIQLPLSRRHPDMTAGNVIMELRYDSDGEPSTTLATGANRVVSDLPLFFPAWISFKINPGRPLTQGKYWIVCKVTEPGV